MGDAVSHAVLPGLALAALLNVPLSLGAFVAGLFSSVATGFLKENSRLKEDAVMGIVFSGMFAVGLVLLTRIETDMHIMHVLFGNILGISLPEVWEMAVIVLIATAIMLVKRKDFMLYCFDPGQASVSGLPVRRLHFGLLILLALTIVASLQAAGIILVIAMLVAPGAVGFLIARTFDQMLLIAFATSVTSCIVGTMLSFYIDASTAPLIVLLQAFIFVLALVFHKLVRNETDKKGVLKSA